LQPQTKQPEVFALCQTFGQARGEFGGEFSHRGQQPEVSGKLTTKFAATQVHCPSDAAADP
jgi:hypothetical protein